MLIWVIASLIVITSAATVSKMLNTAVIIFVNVIMSYKPLIKYYINAWTLEYKALSLIESSSALTSSILSIAK